VGPDGYPRPPGCAGHDPHARRRRIPPRATSVPATPLKWDGIERNLVHKPNFVKRHVLSIRRRYNEFQSVVSSWIRVSVMKLQYLGLLALILMSFATIAAIATALYLYRWRQIITSQQALFVPEELIAQLQSLREGLNNNTSITTESVRRNQASFSAVDKKQNDVSSLVAQVLDASTTWQKALDERDAEIRKLKSGYDLEVFRRFIARFARVRIAIDTFSSESPPDPKALVQLSRLLDDAFDECGVEQFRPIVGEDYRSASGVDDNPKKLATSNPDDAYRIAETISPGFRSRLTNETTVLVPARVSVYIYQAGAE